MYERLPVNDTDLDMYGVCHTVSLLLRDPKAFIKHLRDQMKRGMQHWSSDGVSVGIMQPTRGLSSLDILSGQSQQEKTCSHNTPSTRRTILRQISGAVQMRVFHCCYC